MIGTPVGDYRAMEGRVSDFGVWLKNLNPGGDVNIRALQDFTGANAAVWPYWSNDIADYIRVVSAHATDTTLDMLASTLARLFADWKASSRPPETSFWSRVLVPMAGRLGPFLLAVFGLIVAAILTYGIFFGNFLTSVSKPDQARGLITFLFSFSTIAIFLLVAITTFWMDKSNLGDRFEKAKDLLTLMIGIFGTILGFYYGSLTGKPGEGAQGISLANVGVPNVLVAPGENTTVTATVQGGEAPVNYDLYFNDPTGTVNADGLQVKNKLANGGAIAQPVTIPADIHRPTSITFTLVAHDAKGQQAQSVGTLIVRPGTASQ
jgi:hypothetical protein